jgi:hypothetical protein
MQFFRSAIALGVLALSAVPAPAQSQAEIREIRLTLGPKLIELARKQPECKEFRNACWVCLKKENEEFHCENVSIACSPSGEWKCSDPAPATDAAKR